MGGEGGTLLCVLSSPTPCFACSHDVPICMGKGGKRKKVVEWGGGSGAVVVAPKSSLSLLGFLSKREMFFGMLACAFVIFFRESRDLLFRNVSPFFWADTKGFPPVCGRDDLDASFPSLASPIRNKNPPTEELVKHMVESNTRKGDKKVLALALL